MHFTFNPVPKNFDDAEASCNSQGGHLATYSSVAEHADVEKHFIDLVRCDSLNSMPAMHLIYLVLDDHLCHELPASALCSFAFT